MVINMPPNKVHMKPELLNKMKFGHLRLHAPGDTSPFLDITDIFVYFILLICINVVYLKAGGYNVMRVEQPRSKLLAM